MLNISSYNQIRSPYNQTRSPYNQTQSPYNQTQSPYNQTQSLFNQTKLPYNQTQLPYNQTKTPYNQTQLPYNQIKTPYNQTQLPDNQIKSPDNQTQPSLNTDKSNDLTKVNYGDDNKQFYMLSLPDNLDKDNAKVAVLVHGGAFVGGSALAPEQIQLMDNFLDQGYIVASVDYRVFDEMSPDLSWPAPMEDIAAGINNLFDSLDKQGINVTEKTYLGTSAGADAGLSLLYSDKYDSGENKVPIFDYFISSGAHRNPDGMTGNDQNLLNEWGLNSYEEAFSEEFDPESVNTKALLFEGSEDGSDAYAFTSQSHLSTITNNLSNNGVDVTAKWITDTQYNSHTGPKDAIVDEYKPVMDIVSSFLSEGENNNSIPSTNIAAPKNNLFSNPLNQNNNYISPTNRVAPKNNLFSNPLNQNNNSISPTNRIDPLINLFSNVLKLLINTIMPR